MTNDTIEAKYIMQELEKIVHLDKIIVELKTSSVGIGLLKRCIGTSISSFN